MPDNQLGITMEQQLLQEVRTSLQTVTTGVATLQRGQDLLNTKLFGDAESENSAGRLPKAEFQIAINTSTLQELIGRWNKEVIREGPARLEALERGVIRDGPERMEAVEKGQVKFGVITGIGAVIASAAVTVIMRIVFKV